MRFARHVQVRHEKFGAVIFDTLNEKVYVTNETGRDILAMIREGLDAADMGSRLSEQYAADASEVEADVRAFVSQLEEAGLVCAGEAGA